MAGRTSTSFGVGATIAVLGLLSLTFFVLTAVYFNKYYDRQRQVDQAQAEAQKFVRPDERNRDDVLTLVKEAEKNQKSLVGYLVDSQSRTMEKVTGARRDTVADLLGELQGLLAPRLGPRVVADGRVDDGAIGQRRHPWVDPLLHRQLPVLLEPELRVLHRQLHVLQGGGHLPPGEEVGGHTNKGSNPHPE